ncbi:hypothetical protein FJY84_06455 [Candidatus Bathyarchaeota archaeon]|nr:hypothetical protein [Candidatus Bathyarchaeota archaeon]
MEFSENALKSILLKNGRYIDLPKRQGGDWHHSSEDLWSKIKQIKMITLDDQHELDQLISGLLKVDISAKTH